MIHIVILISGSGSNMAAIVRAAQQEQWEARYHARIALVLSNRPDAKGLDFAREHGIPTDVIDHRAFPSREAFDAVLAQRIAPFDADGHRALVVLAGFMRILSAWFVDRFAQRLLNIHPSLLPAFPGLHTHQRAIEAGCKFAGATVHLVTAELDHGPILEQAVVPILSGDTAETLAARVLSQEHLIYPRAIVRLLQSLGNL
ncbi:phosphoribosylglycinamide formyltransferase [Candidatus Symbiobacter mobilis]|uniref:Phosphoribosylglycinamide formyltransferase n=1 Tax=Candidatus Symbiobacter mobilis CR TaxID=946483 RepID=U5N4D0_9BURK|nr:phosphoribosylglycinamide formyltransferase [Candidatus Symbiobacter mobilis]AGX86187.1 phosphoribosylglycinamide formyltransferase 1 [Candidatus Symbiobacter mobilis CR]